METTFTPAEKSFRDGLDALDARKYREAAAHFQKAMEHESSDGPVKLVRLKYGSYFGLALTLASGRSAEGQQLCEQAVKREFLDADLFCNLGIVSLRNRNKKLAFQAFEKGLAIQPRHARILEHLSTYERRSEPVLPKLSRDHLLNRALGRLRHQVKRLVTPPPRDDE